MRERIGRKYNAAYIAFRPLPGNSLLDSQGRTVMFGNKILIINKKYNMAYKAYRYRIFESRGGLNSIH
jgi:hypothetical protein